LLSPAEGQATAVAARLRAANLNADAALELDGEMITLIRNGVSVRMAQAGPLATRLLSEAGVAIESAEQVTVQIAQGSASIEAVRLGDLRSLGARATVRLGAVRGSAQVAEQQRSF